MDDDDENDGDEEEEEGEGDDMPLWLDKMFGNGEAVTQWDTESTVTVTEVTGSTTQRPSVTRQPWIVDKEKEDKPGLPDKQDEGEGAEERGEEREGEKENEEEEETEREGTPADDKDEEEKQLEGDTPAAVVEQDSWSVKEHGEEAEEQQGLAAGTEGTTGSSAATSAATEPPETVRVSTSWVQM